MLRSLTSREVVEWRAFMRYREIALEEHRDESKDGEPADPDHRDAVRDRDEARRRFLRGEIDEMPKGPEGE